MDAEYISHQTKITVWKGCNIMKLRASQLKIILARLSWIRGHTASNIFFFTSFMKVCNFDLLILNSAKELKRLKTNRPAFNTYLKGPVFLSMSQKS